MTDYSGPFREHVVALTATWTDRIRAKARAVDDACIAAARMTIEDGRTRYVSHSSLETSTTPMDGRSSVVDLPDAQNLLVCLDYAEEYGVTRGAAARALGMTDQHDPRFVGVRFVGVRLEKH